MSRCLTGNLRGFDPLDASGVGMDSDYVERVEF